MKEKDILQALQTAVIAAVAASTSPKLPIKVLGITFTPPSDGKWLEVIHIPNNLNGEFWANSKTYRGIFRLVLHWPIDGAGVYSPMDLASSIADYFAKGAKFTSNNTTVMIYENPDLTSVMEEPPQLLFPMSIRYMSFQQSA